MRVSVNELEYKIAGCVIRVEMEIIFKILRDELKKMVNTLLVVFA